jgi:hydroxyethylthiazole kinase-like uncharacterized protein yjeF
MRVKLVKASEMRTLDQLATSQFGIPGLLLMENAGLKVVEAIREMLARTVAGKPVLILAGRGNNGGDGLVAARHLANAGADLKLFLLGAPEEYRGDAKVNFEIIKRMQLKYFLLREEKDLPALKIALRGAEVVVDAIYGTGFRGRLGNHEAAVVAAVNGSGRPVLAVDIPSGLEADTGQVRGECIRARLTVTFALPKVGQLLEPGAGYVGELRVVDISIPQSLIDAQPISRFVITGEMCRQHLRPRQPDSHKGTYGHVLVVGGSEGFTGAVVLAAQAALRSGAGLVTAAVPGSIYPIIAAKLTEAMVYPLAETGGKTVSPQALAPLGDLLGRATVLAVGPGMGRHPEGVDFLRQLLALSRIPVVIDADGLNLLAEDLTMLANRKAPVILTPHPGEMGRLLQQETAQFQADRPGAAARAARDWGVFVVLKGAKTIVASPEGRIYVNPTGNAGMATGGTGDVLCGIIAGLLAQGLEPEAAAAAGVYLHGAAGDAAFVKTGVRALVAGDLLDSLPAVLKHLEPESFPGGDVW